MVGLVSNVGSVAGFVACRSTAFNFNTLRGAMISPLMALVSLNMSANFSNAQSCSFLTCSCVAGCGCFNAAIKSRAEL